MMAALSTLDGIEDGTDIAVVQGRSRTKWKMSGGRLVDEQGDPLDTWFFTGLVLEGAVHLANFSPPQVGEWFHSSNRDHYWLVVAEEVDAHTPVATFSGGVFYAMQTPHRIVDNGVRERPDWVTDQIHNVLLAMAARMREQQVGLDQTTRHRDDLTRLQTELLTAQSYVNSAVTRINRVRGQS